LGEQLELASKGILDKASVHRLWVFPGCSKEARKDVSWFMLFDTTQDLQYCAKSTIVFFLPLILFRRKYYVSTIRNTRFHVYDTWQLLNNINRKRLRMSNITMVGELAMTSPWIKRAR